MRSYTSAGKHQTPGSHSFWMEVVTMRRIQWIVAAALAAQTACGGATSPLGGGGGGGGGCGGGGDGGGGGGGAGPVGHVTVGNIFFRRAHNGSQNPAVD